MPQTYGADVAQCPRCRKSTTTDAADGGSQIHSRLTLPITSTAAAEGLCLEFMDFMLGSQRQIAKSGRGVQLRPFMGGALRARVKAPRGAAQTLLYVGASGPHVPTRRWSLTGVPMVTRSSWVREGEQPLIAGWNYAGGGEGFAPAYNGNPYAQTQQQFGNCAAPKVIRALYEDLRANRAGDDHNAHWELLGLELTEMWWHPEQTNGKFNVIPSCVYCQQLLPQMLCMRL